MNFANPIYAIRDIDGTTDYVVNFGRLIYNDQILQLNNLLIPFKSQSFFSLPDERGHYAVVNVYYRVETGEFTFDVVTKNGENPGHLSAKSLDNLLPVGQFILHQVVHSFEVTSICDYSKMATYTVTDTFETGLPGLQSGIGETGVVGYSGLQGSKGLTGSVGVTGVQGDTGVGLDGYPGAQGCTGLSQDRTLIVYERFDINDATVVDESIYRNDFTWTAMQAGFTAICYTGSTTGACTGYSWIDRDSSSFVLEPGITGSCHSATYRGYTSAYNTPLFIDLQGFTGLFQAWLRFDVPPKAQFTYAGDTGNPYLYRFTDTSTYFPTSWTWDIDGIEHVNRNVINVFSFTGMHIVSLRACNAFGCSTYAKEVIV